MSSCTTHVIGQSKGERTSENTIRHHVCYAMNKMEMAQQKKIMAEEGTPVVEWYAQTHKGAKMIGASMPYELIWDKDVKHVPMVTCPICSGIGKNGTYRCPICNGSGITKKGHEKKWREWQLQEIKKDMKGEEK